jgi:hypothetical protein
LTQKQPKTPLAEQVRGVFFQAVMSILMDFQPV